MYEWNRCKSDAVYFIKKYCKMDLSKTFQNLVDHCGHNDKSIIKSPRKTGLTTFWAAYSLHALLFNENYQILVSNISNDNSRRFLDILKFLYNDLPEWLRESGMLSTSNRIEFGLSAMHTVGSSTNPEALMGYRYNTVIIDNAFGTRMIPADLPRFFDYILSTCPKIIISNTGVFPFTAFHTLWVGANMPKSSGQFSWNGFEPFTFTTKDSMFDVKNAKMSMRPSDYYHSIAAEFIENSTELI